MILSTKLLRPINTAAGKVCDVCQSPAAYYDAALPVDSFAFYCSSHSFLEDLDPDDMRNDRMLMGCTVSRKAGMPAAGDFEELFAKIELNTKNTRKGNQLWVNTPTLSGLEKWDVVLRPEVEAWLRANSIYGSDPDLDKNHFVTINRIARDGQDIASIRFTFQQILGSHLLAMVPWKTVENFFGVKPQ